MWGVPWEEHGCGAPTGNHARLAVPPPARCNVDTCSCSVSPGRMHARSRAGDLPNNLNASPDLVLRPLETFAVCVPGFPVVRVKAGQSQRMWDMELSVGRTSYACGGDIGNACCNRGHHARGHILSFM